MEEEFLIGKTLLVVDDEVDLRDIMVSELEFMGARVLQAGNISAAKEVLKNHPIDLIVSDIRMPGGTGVDLLDYVKAQDAESPPVVLITGFADITIEDAFNKGAEALVNKPFKIDDLVQVVARNTLPHGERFNLEDVEGTQNLELTFDRPLEDIMATRKVMIGRGGISLVLSLTRKKIEHSESINFDLQFTDLRLQGVATCRWRKAQEDGTHVALGLEFMRLEEKTLSFLKGYWRDHPMIAYMPIP